VAKWLKRRSAKPFSETDAVKNLSVSTLAKLTGFSQAYISMVKSGKRSPSPRLLKAIGDYYRSHTKPRTDYFGRFMQSRKSMGCTESTLRYYQSKLSVFLSHLDPDYAKAHHLEKFLLQFSNVGNCMTYYRVVSTFYVWREEAFDLPNPMRKVKPPKQPKLILPALTREEVLNLIQSADTIRDKAIIALFVESGLRLSELANIRHKDINWESKTVVVLGKGQKEALAPFGSLSERYLKEWMMEFNPNGHTIWGLNECGISSMLSRLTEKTGIKCNPHTFRRTFACPLRKAGIDCLTIRDLGRWESVSMVERYTRSITFQDSLKHYKAPLS